jgi:hypothetical protein
MYILRSIAVCLWTVTGLVQAANFTNPLKDPNGSDPFIVYDGGYYYFTTTTWTDVQITRAKTLEGLKTGERKTVWKDDNALRCCQVWAPGECLSGVLISRAFGLTVLAEIHKLDGTWYVYYTAGRKDGDLGGQRAFVLKGMHCHTVLVSSEISSSGSLAYTSTRGPDPVGHIQLSGPADKRLGNRRNGSYYRLEAVLHLVVSVTEHAKSMHSAANLAFHDWRRVCHIAPHTFLGARGR